MKVNITLWSWKLAPSLKFSRCVTLCPGYLRFFFSIHFFLENIHLVHMYTLLNFKHVGCSYLHVSWIYNYSEATMFSPFLFMFMLRWRLQVHHVILILRRSAILHCLPYISVQYENFESYFLQLNVVIYPRSFDYGIHYYVFERNL